MSPKPHEDYLLVLITLHLVEEDFQPSVPSLALWQLRHCIKDLSLDFLSTTALSVKSKTRPIATSASSKGIKTQSVQTS